jgi:hypothetical protein
MAKLHLHNNKKTTLNEQSNVRVRHPAENNMKLIKSNDNTTTTNTRPILNGTCSQYMNNCRKDDNNNNTYKQLTESDNHYKTDISVEFYSF